MEQLKAHLWRSAPPLAFVLHDIFLNWILTIYKRHKAKRAEILTKDNGELHDDLKTLQHRLLRIVEAGLVDNKGNRGACERDYLVALR